MQVDAVTTPSRPALGTVRRFYFYLVTLIAFTAGLIAFTNLVEALVEAWAHGPWLQGAWLHGAALYVVSGTAYVRSTVAQTASYLAVATPIFLIHWGYIQRNLIDEENRTAALRKFFIAVVSAISLGYALVFAHHILSGIAALAFGQRPDRSDILPAAWLSDLIVAAAAAILLAYWQAAARADGDYGVERGLAGTWRRLYLAGVTLAGLVMIAVGSADIFSALIHRLQDTFQTAILGGWFPREVGDGISLVLLGAVTARTAWRAWQAICDRVAEERTATVLLLFLYVAVVLGAVATLVPAAVILRYALLALFHTDQYTAVAVMARAASIAGYIPVGIWVWVRHWRLLQGTEERQDRDGGANASALTLRRIYYYTVSATGLVLLWVGLVFVLQALFDVWLTADQLKASVFWQKPLATGLSLLVVGGPVWVLHWQAVQRVARQPDNSGANERTSLPRRIYLYGVLFVGAVIVLFFLAEVLYHVMLYALGDRSGALFWTVMAEDLARSVVAAVLWAIHFLALRRDMALGGPVEAQSDRRQRLEERVATLEAELARARAALEEMDNDNSSIN